MPAWPEELPSYLLTEGYDESLPDGLLRTGMDAGPAKVRARFSAAVRPIKGTLVCSRSQVETLALFVADDLDGGALAFDWVHPRTQDACSMRLVGQPSLVPEPGSQWWRVGLELEILP